MATTNENDAVEASTQPTHEVPPDERLGVELGVDTNLAFMTPFRAVTVNNGTGKNSDELLNEVPRNDGQDWGPTVRQLVAMRRMDGHARALYRLLTLPIRAGVANATFEPAEGDAGEAEFIEAVFTTPAENGGMTVTFQRFMSQLLQGLFDGFAAFEKVFWVPEFGPLAGKYTLQKLAHRPSETISFISDAQGGFAGLRQRAHNSTSTDVYIEGEYALYYAAQEEERKFYGVSFFQSAFYHYDAKVRMYYTMHLAAQRAAVGTRAGTYPANASASQKREFAQQLSNLSLAQWMMMPENFKVEVLKEGGTFQFLETVNHHNAEMSKSILANFFDKDAAAADSNAALVNFADPGDEMFKLMLKTIQDDIAATINHYVIPQLIDYNFDGQHYPTFKWGTLTDEQKKAIAATFSTVLASSLSANISPEFVRAIEEHQAEEYGLDIDYDEVEQREADEKAQMTMQANGQVPDPNDPAGKAPLSPDDSQLSQFEQQAVSLTMPTDETREAYRELLDLAGEILNAAE